MQNQTYVPIHYTELLEDEDVTTSAREDEDVASTFRVGCVEDEDIIKEILDMKFGGVETPEGWSYDELDEIVSFACLC